MAKLETAFLSICKCENILPFDVGNVSLDALWQCSSFSDCQSHKVKVAKNNTIANGIFFGISSFAIIDEIVFGKAREY